MRKRLTWDEDGLGKRASSELPDEGAASPAHQPEKGVDAYGMNSDFGSEPTSGPYGNGEHPSTPDEGPASPAFKAAALERKAAKCIRIASAMLGGEATVAAVEDQALALMDLSDRAIQASLERLADDDDDDDDEEVEEVEVEESKKKASLVDRIARLERVLIRLAESEDPKGDGAKGSKDPRGEKDGAKGSEDPGEPNTEGKKAKDSMDEDMDEDDAAAAEGLKSKKAESKEKAEKDESEDYGGNKGDDSESDKDFEGKKKADWQAGHRAPGGWDPGSEESMLESMLEEEGMWGSNKDEYKRTDGHRDGDVDGHYKDYEGMHHDEVGHIVHSDEMDPMGVGFMMSDDDEMMMLAKLFDKSADIPAGEDKKEKEDHEKGAVADDKDHIKKLEKDEKEDKADLKKDEESKKKAALKPQPKKESTGATRLGGVTKAAKSEVSDLSQLWNSAPDVSKFF